MKNINFGQTVSILANAGVIASIIFLAVEVRDNAAQARISTAQNTTELWNNWRYRITDDSALAEIYRVGLADFHSLSESDKLRFDNLMKANIAVVISTITAQDAGLSTLDTELARVRQGDRLAMHFDYPGFRAWWQITDKRDIPVQAIPLLDEALRIRAQNRLPE